jgi:rSAM/selenodomain-associated transferase 2
LIAPLPSISVIIPTLNEERVIGPLVNALLGESASEIIVVDGGSTDRTIEIAATGAIVLDAPACRGAQMNAGATAASGDVLLFLHADARLRRGALQRVAEAMADPAVTGGSFDLHFEGTDFATRAFTRINRARRKLGVFYGDAGIFCRRVIFLSLGGYHPWPVLEDYEFARRLGKSGRLALLEEPIWVSSRRWRRAGLFPTIWSWFWIQTLYLAGVSPRRLARMYRDVR